MLSPAPDLRGNLGTWAVSSSLVPTVAYQMTQTLPPEEFDPEFLGQDLTTTYFDTRAFTLRKARRHQDKYLTLRIRCYRSPRADGAGEVYAVSAKTEKEKFRQFLPSDRAALLLADGIAPDLWPFLLPAHLVARLLELVGQTPLVPVVAVCCRRHAVEDSVNRLTLDLDVRTDTGKVYPSHVLEWKSSRRGADLALPVRLRPIKLSKFLWATTW